VTEYIRLKNVSTSITTADLIVGGKVPKRKPPRPGSKVFLVRVRPEPPEGWRPDGLPRPPART
jgi:hypothetical protein